MGDKVCIGRGLGRKVGVDIRPGPKQSGPGCCDVAAAAGLQPCGPAAAAGWPAWWLGQGPRGQSTTAAGTGPLHSGVAAAGCAPAAAGSSSAGLAAAGCVGPFRGPCLCCCDLCRHDLRHRLSSLDSLHSSVLLGHKCCHPVNV
ncbi:hypothetical protein K7X08_001125 [Anisodus acutangulus]|uniref:Uncharacterized protein n=1 Tax=Anisodus acutangulus TaxID=402998 RepID=A0A9Q1RKA8_9SOLA|nr:hypothetical protein K7X08_001125 [Anisodus acutangulus]